MEGKFTDEIFFQKLQEGDPGKLKEFFNDSFALFVAFARNYLGQDDTCEDVVQDTFVAFWEQRASFKNIYYVKAFFYKTIRHKCLNYIRHQKITSRHASEEQQMQNDLADKSYFIDTIIQEEASRMIYEEILKLSNMGRQVMLLALDGYSNEEIAEKLGISVNTVRTHKARTYQYLRERLGELRILLLILFPY
ncbi:RNA polymerase sigma factor [Butyricimonas hominis]|jgi:RNA polymerase sigma factor, sigma-70 family|uniref:Sigma-70 family RNA polymerase sigma factor n=1 Tax=Butyricimonas hominis TaxID=2763032 RepID=A0ABR7CXC9_9BACT|nr:sigma-70 family RNA polymerase sigma factor [Butyricimonas hominis]MBC5620341.1 sigma-70 family RNA polymerase sigma factor [Butyricimonas hominis]